MSLFATADLHLSLGGNKPMDVFRGWTDYVARLEKNWRSIVKEEDTVVIAGDVSWGMSLTESIQDFAWIDSMPGQKLILKGNHDYWWVTKRKMDTFFEEQGFSTLKILHNNHFVVGSHAVCGTRGWFYDDAKNEDKKVLLREAGRLRMSIESAEKEGYTPIVFLHYPPVYSNMVCAEMMEVLKRHNIRRCCYGHIHGASSRFAVTGGYDGIDFRLISCDYTGFTPVLIEG